MASNNNRVFQPTSRKARLMIIFQDFPFSLSGGLKVLKEKSTEK